MKKIILGLCLSSLLIGFTPVYAVEVPLVQVDQNQLIKQQLIQLLTQMIATLQSQLNQILAQQAVGMATQPIENQVTQTPITPVAPIEQTPVKQVVVPSKELIVTTIPKGDCTLMKASVNDEDGMPFYGNNSYNVKVIARAFPNRVSIIGIMKDNNEYLYCPSEKIEDNVIFTIDTLGLKKIVTITP